MSNTEQIIEIQKLIEQLEKDIEEITDRKKDIDKELGILYSKLIFLMSKEND